MKGVKGFTKLIIFKKERQFNRETKSRESKRIPETVSELVEKDKKKGKEFPACLRGGIKCRGGEFNPAIKQGRTVGKNKMARVGWVDVGGGYVPPVKGKRGVKKMAFQLIQGRGKEIMAQRENQGDVFAIKKGGGDAGLNKERRKAVRKKF